MSTIFKIRLLGLKFLIAFLTLAGISYGQSDFTFSSNSVKHLIPPSPEVSALGRYVSTPVGLYTGVPEITIPIYDINAGDIDVPVLLSYHAGGHLVEDIAPRTGMGWTLEAGGVISRTIVGEADEYSPEGFLAVAKQISYENLIGGQDWMKKSNWENILLCGDAEPDQFSFNFAGYTGKFSFDWNGKIVVSSERSVKIEPVRMPDPYALSFIDAWKVTGDDGTVYYFEEKETTATPFPYNKYYPCNYRDIHGNFVAPVTSWYLTHIRSQKGDLVTFTYEPYTLAYTVRLSESIYHKEGADVTKKSYTTRRKTIAGKHLTGIHASGGINIRFIKGTNKRTDIPRHFDFNHPDNPKENALYSLQDIIITNHFEQKVKHFALRYTYDIGRLTLKSISEVPVDGSAPTKPPLGFEYNSTKLPEIRQDVDVYWFKEQDHWGYLNNNGEPTLLPPYTVRFPNGSVKTYDPSATREPHPVLTKAGILEKIIYPTGGTTTFEFEPHDYHFVGNSAVETKIAGGLRIRKIIDYDGLDHANDIIRRYDYTINENQQIVSSGVLSVAPSYIYLTRIHDFFEGAEAGLTIPAIARTSSSVVSLGSTRGSHIGYRKVTVLLGENGEGGKSESEFSSFYSDNDDYSNKSLEPPFAPPISFDFKRGLLKKQVDYKYENGAYIPVRQIDNLYEDISQSIPALKVGEACEGCITQYGTYRDITFYTAEQIFLLGKYQYKLGFSKLKKSIETLYDNTVSFSTERTYYYNPSLQFLTEEISKTSSGREQRLQYFYPFNYSSNVFNLMKEKNMLSPVVEKVVREKASDGVFRVIDGAYTQFDIYPDNKVLPYQEFKFWAGAPASDFVPSISGGGWPDFNYYKRSIVYNVYDPAGRIQEVTSPAEDDLIVGDYKTSFIWDISADKVIAEITNAKYSRCAYTSFEGLWYEGNWLAFEAPVPTDAKTGRRSYRGSLSSSGPLEEGEYRLSLWARGSGTVTINGISKSIDGDWKRYEWVLTNPGTININTNNNLIDELRLHPAGAQMKTFTYESLVGVSSITDENSNTVSFEYDNLGRLKTVRDSERNIVKNHQYHYKQN